MNERAQYFGRKAWLHPEAPGYKGNGPLRFQSDPKLSFFRYQPSGVTENTFGLCRVSGIPAAE